MKIQVSVLSVALASFAAGVFAQDETQVAQLSIKGGEQMLRPNPGRATPEATLPLPAEEVVKMSRAGVSETTLLNYVGTSPAFLLTAEDVLTLHHRGVSLNVITAMLQHRPSEMTTQPPPAPPPQMATVATLRGPNPPIIYPTPAKEAVPLTDPVVVIYGSGGYAYGAPSVIISQSSFYQGGYQGSGFSGGIPTLQTYSGGFYRYGPSYRSSSYRTSSYGYASPVYGCSARSCDFGYSRRCRY